MLGRQSRASPKPDQSFLHSCVSVPPVDVEQDPACFGASVHVFLSPLTCSRISAADSTFHDLNPVGLCTRHLLLGWGICNPGPTPPQKPPRDAPKEVL